jgi:hypothetical protein
VNVETAGATRPFSIVVFLARLAAFDRGSSRRLEADLVRDANGGAAVLARSA